MLLFPRRDVEQLANHCAFCLTNASMEEGEKEYSLQQTFLTWTGAIVNGVKNEEGEEKKRGGRRVD